MAISYNESEVINIEDTVTGLAMLDKLSRIKDGRRIQPLADAQNIKYSHRYLYDEYNLQIGDTYFMIPPEFIMVNSEATSQSIITLRQENTQKLKSGYHKRVIMIDLVFNGLEQLNGYPVDGPESEDKKYYVDGLRQLLAQFKCTPFLPITNELINGTFGVFTVALQAITMHTVQGFPDVMTAQITLQEVNMFPYTEMPDVCFRNLIDWDLFRFYYQRLLTETKEYRKLQSLPANKEYNKFKISILDESVFKSKEATKTNMLNLICDKEIVKVDENGNPADSNFTLWLDSNESDVFITEFHCGYSNILNNIQMSDMSSPTVQFMGGMDTIYNINFETTDYLVVQALEKCQITNDLLTRNNIKLRSVGFVKLESELVAFTGSLFVMVESVVTNTVPGFPGLYNVQMTCVAFDIAQSEREELHGFRPFECKEPDCINNDFEPDHVHDKQAIEQSMDGLKVKIKQDNYAEWKLRTSIEMYPDLHLPTYKEVNDFITKCNTFRKNKGLDPLPYTDYPTNPVCMIHGANPDNNIKVPISHGIGYMDEISRDGFEYDIYVDPDFYVFYPCSYLSFNGETLDDGSDYYGYSSKQRSSVTKTKTVVRYPNYTGVAARNLIEQFITLAMNFIGHTYVLGAAGDITDEVGKCFDCSGFITYLFKEIGIMTPNQARITVSAIPTCGLFEEVEWNKRQRGDVLCHTDMSHVVIYRGNNLIVHASNEAPYPDGGVKEGGLYFEGRCFRPKAFTETVNISANAGTGLASYDSIETIINQDLGNWHNITTTEMNDWIASKAREGSPFVGQGDIFIQAGYESGLDPRYILAHAAIESGWGTSDICKDKNNYFGIGAFDSSPYESAYSFSSGLATGIIEGAKWIAEHYYNGDYNQKTLYSMRWNVVNGKATHQYATDTKWDTSIASIMVGAPSGFGSTTTPSTYTTTSGGTTETVAMSSAYTLTYDEFDSICRVVMAETQGETPEAEKAMAQVIYDRLTHKNKKFGGLSNILTQGEQFEAPYQGELNDTIEANVKAVFCENNKYWPDSQAWYFVTPDDTTASYHQRNAEYDKIDELDMHTYWGENSPGSSITYSLVESSSVGGAGVASRNEVVDTYKLLYEVDAVKDVARFAEPVLAKTDAIVYDETWQFWKNDEHKANAKEYLNDGLNIFNTSFCDEYQYSGRGRLIRAFPTYLFCILDDNAQWFDGKKLWTNYYIHKSVVDIAVHGTNDMPTETATITITNSYHNLDRTQGGLDSYNVAEDEGYSDFQRMFYKSTHLLLSFGPKLTDKLIKLNQVICDHAKLREGARIHLRMGYGSDPLALAPVMNGHISSVSLGDQITMTVTSDGHELIQHITAAAENVNKGFLGIFGLADEQESSNIIAELLTDRQSWVNYLMTDTFEGSKYSIEHFGLYFNQDAMELFAGVAKGAIAGGALAVAGGATGGKIGAAIGSVIPGAGTVVGATVGALAGAGIGALIATRNASDITVADLWNGVQEQYDILKNIYKADYTREHYIYSDFASDGEQNVVFNSYNMTPWDVFQVCTQQVPEYIVKPSYHQFDSRLYFGLPSWMEKYRYDYLGEEIYEECKASTQVHFLESLTNIIDNQVKVTGKFSNTNMKVMYTRGEEATTTQTLHSDDTIDFAYQKTGILDTPITQDALGPDLIYEIVGYSIGEDSARRVGISNLLYGWQQQYQGQFILMGSPGIKPHDYIIVSDSYANMYGVAIVREVVHSFNTNTGFTTSVTPGMIGFSTDENSGLIVTCQNLLNVLNNFASFIETRRQLKNNYEYYLEIFENFEVLRNKMNTILNDDNELSKLQLNESVISGVAYGTTAFLIAKNIRNLAKAKQLVSTFKTAYAGASGANKIMKVVSGIKAGTMAVTGFTPIGVAVLVASILVDILLDEVFEWLDNKNVCVLLPLWWENYPFVCNAKNGENILLCKANSTTEENKQSEDRIILDE